MPIGTSDGATYEDSFDQAVSKFMPVEASTEPAGALKTDLGTEVTPSFDTRLNSTEEAAFQTWKSKYAPQDSGADYDLRGAFKADLNPDPQTGHWPDTFKKPNHPTFSNESQYAAFGNPGHWEGNVFRPPAGEADSNWRWQAEPGTLMAPNPPTVTPPDRSYHSQVLPISRDAQGNLTLSVPGALEGVLKNIHTFMSTEPGSAENIAASTNVATDLGVGGFATAPLRPGLGLFGGKMTKEAVQVAERMEGKGASEVSIKQVTGLERGADKMWRNEFSDLPSKYKPENFDTVDMAGLPGTEANTLDQVLHHPELFRTYPEAKDIVVIKREGLDVKGFYDPVNNAIQINSKLNDTKAHSTLLHEIQHWIQNKEGFSMTTVGELPQKFTDEFKGYLIRQYGKDATNKITNLLLQGKETEAAALAERLLKDVHYNTYTSLSSEAEARAVQKRMNLDRYEIKATLGRTAEDVPRNEQIVHIQPNEPYLIGAPKSK